MNLRATHDVDVAVIGGAPVGCAVARDAAGRGLSVSLFESADLGGDFAGQIVLSGLRPHDAAARQEDRVLQRICPHLVSAPPAPKSFLSRLGLTARIPVEVPPPNAQRFAVLNARDAHDRGARIMPNTAVDKVEPDGNRWRLALNDGVTVRATVVVDTRTEHHDDGKTWRVAIFSDAAQAASASFVVPCGSGMIAGGYLADPDPGALWISEAICVPDHTTPSFTLSQDPLPLIRTGPIAAGLARKLAEDIVAEMVPFVRMIGKRWTRHATLPGGDFNPGTAELLLSDLHRQNPDLSPEAVDRLFAAYGTEAFEILGAPRGQIFGAGLTEAEVTWLRGREWARSATDVVWRRSLLGASAQGELGQALTRFFSTPVAPQT